MSFLAQQARTAGNGFRAGLVISLAGTGGLILAAPAGAGEMAPSVTSGLADGQIITVNVSGFADPDPGQLTLLQCSPGATSSSGCEPATLDVLVTNGDGTGSAPYAVQVVPGRCDAATACALFAVESPLRFDNDDPQSRFASTPISFGSTAAGPTLGPADAPPAEAAQGPDPVVPEVPMAVLLPLAAAATLGAGALAQRRRARSSL